MNTSFFANTTFVVLLIMATSLSASATEDEWRDLFNGRDLTGWQNARHIHAQNKWSIDDGAMTNVEHGNDIATVEKFKNFELALEYKTVKGGNSGVYLRGRVEIQVLDSSGKNPPTNRDDGAIYDCFAPKVNASNPIGKWNKLEVKYVGNRLTATLNGKIIHKKQKITKVTGGALPGNVNDAGPLMLQGDHGTVWYRNIRIKPLDKKATQAEPTNSEKK